MKKFILLILLSLMFIPFYVNAETMKAADYIKKIATENGGNDNSIEVINNTDLAYDGTNDNNLRYVGLNPNNYLKFYDAGFILKVKGNITSNVSLLRGGTDYPTLDECINTGIGERLNYFGFVGSAQCKPKDNGNYYIEVDGVLTKFGTVYKDESICSNYGIKNIYKSDDSDLEVSCQYYDRIDNDNLYRIIGVFGNNIKIMNSKMTNDVFDSNNNGIWENSSLTRKVVNNYVNQPYGLQELAINTNWYVGTVHDNEINQSAVSIYNKEKMDFWEGNVGILNASDYIFATTGSDVKSRYNCLNDDSHTYGAGCLSNNWIYKMKGTYSRAIIFMERTREEWNVIISDTSWALQSMYAKYKGDYSECYYIDEKAIIESGNGTKNQPYIIRKTSSNNIYLNNNENYGIVLGLIDENNIEEQSKVTFKIIPKEGYEVENIEIKDKKNIIIEYRKTDKENEYEFTMPDTDVEITPIYKKIESIEIPNTIENPNTGTGSYVVISIIVLVFSSSIYLIMKKRKITL